MSDNVILEVKDLHKYYEKQEVLKGISTTIRKGDVIAIIGPSGCGKSTFLRSLNLLEVPTKGQILFEGTDITDKKRLFRGNGGLKTATTPVFIHAKRHSVFDLEVECVYQSIQGTPYRAYFVCF